MEFKVEIVSTEKIKPSSPTPFNLRTFKLSIYDQFVPYPYAPITFYYLPKNFPSQDHQLDISNNLQTLKRSLSQILTLYYSLVGTIKDNLSINCNDEGAYFKQAKVNCTLHEFLSKPNLLLLDNFLPDDLVIKPSNVGDSVTNIQANVFECGGIALGLCISHKIVDGSALSFFIKAWSSMAFGCSKENIIIHPNFDSAPSFVPAKELSIKNASNIMWGSFIRKGNGVVKRFVFDASALSTLKAQASSSYVQNPTRIEAISALIWKAKLAASKETYGKARPSLITHNVNLRRRLEPSLPENYIGNRVWLACAKCLDENSNEGLGGLVSNLRDGFRKFDSEFVKNMGKGEEGYSLTLMLKSIREISEYAAKDGVDYLGMNSWCNFGFYEADFGWGKPIWISFCGGSEESKIYCPYVNFVDTKSGDGIEAWMFIEEQEMTKLESNPELVKYISVDPSPLFI